MIKGPNLLSVHNWRQISAWSFLKTFSFWQKFILFWFTVNLHNLRINLDCTIIFQCLFWLTSFKDVWRFYRAHVNVERLLFVWEASATHEIGVLVPWSRQQDIPSLWSCEICVHLGFVKILNIFLSEMNSFLIILIL